ncbi:MAG TPA: hypothetical protein VH092_32680, partial [Urbifossiella sp.]|nr:hypothetical protein [Urbifossiella sp.]
MPAPNRARDADALLYRAQGWTFERIAQEMGYSNKSSAKKAVDRAREAGPRETRDEAKVLILADLMEAKRHAWEVLGREHVVVSNGRVVRRYVGLERDEDGIERLDPDGKTIKIFEDVPDDGAVLSAIDRIVRIDAEIAKVVGAYAPTRHEVRTIGEIDARLLELADEV